MKRDAVVIVFRPGAVSTPASRSSLCSCLPGQSENQRGFTGSL